MATNSSRTSSDVSPPSSPQAEVDDKRPDDEQTPEFIVAIGASAGGLEPLDAFFGAMPKQSGMAFVVIQHLSPDHKSLMDELLARHTEMRIRRVEDGMLVERDTIYLIPPKKQMGIVDGRLTLAEKPRTGQDSLLIDHFFRSLARDVQERAIAIVLSGSGSDGSRGIIDIHEVGGLTIAQAPQTARFNSMPQAAIESNAVEVVLTPEAMPQALMQYADDPYHRPLMVDTALPEIVPGSMGAILGQLREAFGVDFSLYKPTTIRRRLKRRMQLASMRELEEYIKLLKQDDAELGRLYNDLLIGVTEFFRDPQAFEALKSECIADLLRARPSTEPIRVWVAACCTGEEAYSVAIAFREAMREDGEYRDVKLFATDLHRKSLDIASAGLYDAEALKNVPEELRARHFTPESGRFRVTREIRKMIVFAPHNLLHDAPFTRMDLICCRNLLIYLMPLAQNKVLSLFHFSLGLNGYLFLGQSETVGVLGEEFGTVESSAHLFRKLRDVRLSPAVRLPMTVNEPDQHILNLPVRMGGLDQGIRQAYDMLLDAHIPAGILVNPQREVLHTFGGAARFLTLPEGRTSKDLLDHVSGDLKLVLSTGLARVFNESAPVVFETVRIAGGEEVEAFKVSIRPLGATKHDYRFAFVHIEPKESPAVTEESREAIQDDNISAVSQVRIRGLENEVRHTKEHLQATIEELETSNEELQATNEELISSNEELQSTNEELHSVNEELHTVNAEYQQKIHELAELSADMENLLASTDIGTIFLDMDLCIRKFTPAASAAFNLRASDVGRPIGDIANKMREVDLDALIENALGSSSITEQEVETRDGTPLLLRLLPYQDEHDEMEGMVITLVDVTVVRRAQEELRRSEVRFRKTFDNAAVGMAHVSDDGQWLLVNQRLCDIVGYTRDVLLTMNFKDLTHPEDLKKELVERELLRKGEIEAYRIDKRYFHKSGKEIWVRLTVSAQRDPAGKIEYFISLIEDISESKRFETALRDSEYQYRLLLHSIPLKIFYKNRELTYQIVNDRFAEDFGLRAADVAGKTDFEFFPKELADKYREDDARIMESGNTLDFEEDYMVGGEQRTVRTLKVPVRDSANGVVGLLGIFWDVTAQKKAEKERRLSNRDLRRRNAELDDFVHTVSHDLKSPLVTIQGYTAILDEDLQKDRFDRLAKYLPRISNSATRMGRLIEDLLVLSRMGHTEAIASTIDLGELFADIVGEGQEEIEARGIEIGIASDLPEFTAESSRLRQALQNLLLNAVRHGSSGAPPRIELGARSQKNRVQIFVRDNGKGVPREFQDKIFGLFRRLNTDSEGNGVGLAIVRRVAEFHGGRVWVESAPDAGATFWMEIPDNFAPDSLPKEGND